MNKQIKFIVLLVLMSFAFLTSYGQLGIQAGYIFSNSNGNLDLGDSKEFTGTFRNNGFQAGLTYDITIKGDLSMQTGILYSFLTGTTEESKNILNITKNGTIKTESTYQYLDLPIRVAYSLPVTNEFKIYFFAGPNLTYGLSGKSKASATGRVGNNLIAYNNMPEYNVFKDFKEQILPFDVKLGFGGGVQYKHYRFRAGYDFGLLNQYKGIKRKNDNGNINKLRRGQLGISLAYIF